MFIGLDNRGVKLFYYGYLDLCKVFSVYCLYWSTGDKPNFQFSLLFSVYWISFEFVNLLLFAVPLFALPALLFLYDCFFELVLLVAQLEIAFFFDGLNCFVDKDALD